VELEGGRERASVSSKDPFRDDESSDSFRRLFLYVYSSDSIRGSSKGIFQSWLLVRSAYASGHGKELSVLNGTR
jgi:hypothetical protein